MGKSFSTELDIVNRALQHCGVRQITSFTDGSKAAFETQSCYNKLRDAELRDNIWRFATRRTCIRPMTNGTMQLIPGVWSATKIYFNGSIVDDGTGTLWASTAPSNLNNAPSNNSNFWTPYFGPLMASLFDPTQGYWAGELVYEVTGKNNEKMNVYVARKGITANPAASTQTSAVTQGGATTLTITTTSTTVADDPSVGSAWLSTTQYQKNTVVKYNGFFYMSLFDGNVGNTPGTYTLWNNAITYAANAIVASYADGNLYITVNGGTGGLEPSVDNTGNWLATGDKNPWTTSFLAGTGSNDYQILWDAQLADVNFNYPISTGPVIQTQTRNAYRLPAGFLRPAPQDPKAGSTNFLGAPSGHQYEDWVYDGDFIISMDNSAIVYRFVADITTVTEMDPMFCEALAARIGMEVCEALTQSNAKINTISSAYKRFIDRAKTTNGIEVGPIEPPEDDWITCRL